MKTSSFTKLLTLTLSMVALTTNTSFADSAIEEQLYSLEQLESDFQIRHAYCCGKFGGTLNNRGGCTFAPGQGPHIDDWDACLWPEDEEEESVLLSQS